MTTLPATRFTELVGCCVPIQQAGMGGITTPALAAAVAAEGGLGMLAGAGVAAGEIVEQLGAAAAAAHRDARIGVNFLVPFLDVGAFEAAASGASVVECFYGDPDAQLVQRAHDAGTLAAWQVGSSDEASAAVDAGCDFIVVQGQEAGGHVRGRQSLMDVLDATRRRVDVPIVAAGGIGSGRAVARALLAGADAVRVGTRFVATAEADVHPDYARALVSAAADDTVVTETFAAGWPDAPHRVLRSAVAACDDAPASRSPVPPTRDFNGDVTRAALYAGTSVDAVTAVTSARDVVRQLVAEAAAALASGSSPAG